MSRALPLAITTLAVFGGACDLIESAKSTIVVAGILAATPEVKLAGQFDVESETLATVYLGERDSPTSSEAPSPIKGANVAIQFSGNSVVLKEEDGGEDGVYLADSVREPKLLYADGTLYTFAADISGNDAGPFGGGVTAPTRLSPASLTLTPAPEAIPLVPNVYRHPKSADLTITWTEANGRYAYVTVLRADAANPGQPQQVYDSRPKTGQDMIKFIIGTPPTSLTVPGSVFDSDAAYAVLVVVADKGDPQTNTFLGSPLLAGSGEKVLLAVGTFMP
jgi:hypothetical protein